MEFPKPKYSYREQDTLDVNTAVAIALNNCSQRWEAFEMERLEGELLLQNLGQLPLQVWQESIAQCDRLRYLDRGWVTQSDKSIYPVPNMTSRIISVDRFYKQVQKEVALSSGLFDEEGIKSLGKLGQPLERNQTHLDSLQYNKITMEPRDQLKKADPMSQDFMNPHRSPPDLSRLCKSLDRFLEKVGQRATDGSVSFTGKQWSLTKQEQRLCIFEGNRKLWESQGDAIVTFKMNALELEKLRQLCQQFEADPSLSEPIVHSYSREQGQTSLQMNQLTKPLQR